MVEPEQHTSHDPEVGPPLILVTTGLGQLALMVMKMVIAACLTMGMMSMALTMAIMKLNKRPLMDNSMHMLKTRSKINQLMMHTCNDCQVS